RIFEGGRYIFRAIGAQLFLDGEELREEPIELRSGLHAIRLVASRSSRDERAGYTVDLRWSGELFVEEPVPARVFVHRPGSFASQLRAERGRTLIEDRACAACHDGAPRLETIERGPRLSPFGTPRKRAWLARFLAGPADVKSDTIMPSLLDPSEALDVASFLARVPRPGDAARGDAHSSFRGRGLWEAIGCAACHGSDPVALGDLESKWPRDALVQYLLDPASTHPEARMPSFGLSEEEATHLADHLLPGTKEPSPGDESVTGDPERGRRLVEERGCLRCHDIADEGIVDRSAAPPWSELRAGSGCLGVDGSDANDRGTPRHRLSREDRDAIAASLEEAPRPDPAHPAPVREARRRVERLRCVACHEVDAQDPAGVLRERAPPLSEIGSKLHVEWLRRALSGEARVRPQLALRMPRFADGWTDGLADGLARARGAGGRAPELLGSPQIGDQDVAHLRERGRDLLGRDASRGGLACVACHDWGRYEPLADERGPQLVGITDRLRFEWFRRFIYAPARILPGTPMPELFPPPATPESDDAILSLWVALASASTLEPPAGIGDLPFVAGTESMPVPGSRAVVLRFPLAGTTAAAISVGLPKRGREPITSFAFDAATCALAFAWEGGFLNLGESLGKTRKDPAIVGEIRYRSAKTSLRFGSIDSEPKTRFRGYRLDASHVPEFRYEVDGHEVREMIVARRGGGSVRRLVIDRVDGDAWLVPEPSSDVTITTSLGPLEDGRLRLP
ncbi:MAG TPA: c-type cytochrome, partial [Planctomycetota bacterium]|nr:c-type cytochrome [Planctomycetota bacterium]